MNTPCHLEMVQAALADKMDSESLTWLMAANRRIDDHYPDNPEMHFDNCPDLKTIQRRWSRGLNRFFSHAIVIARPETIKRNRKWVFQSLGYASHVLQDFYAHTTWIELHADKGVYDTLAPLLDSSLQLQAFPAEISSGYYDSRYGDTGCPQCDGDWKPPRGYRYCHEQIAKDYPHKKHGADIAAPDGRTFFDITLSLATRATAQLWNVFEQRLLEAYASEEPLKLLTSKSA